MNSIVTSLLQHIKFSGCMCFDEYEKTLLQQQQCTTSVISFYEKINDFVVVKYDKNTLTATTNIGLNWRNMTESKSEKERLKSIENLTGAKLTHKNLSAALQKKIHFTQSEWDSFSISNLTLNDFIVINNNYFKPVDRHIIVIFDSSLWNDSWIPTDVLKEADIDLLVVSSNNFVRVWKLKAIHLNNFLIPPSYEIAFTLPFDIGEMYRHVLINQNPNVSDDWFQNLLHNYMQRGDSFYNDNIMNKPTLNLQLANKSVTESLNSFQKTILKDFKKNFDISILHSIDDHKKRIRGVFLFIGVGMGKTKISLDIASVVHTQKKNKKSLFVIVADKSISTKFAKFFKKSDRKRIVDLDEKDIDVEKKNDQEYHKQMDAPIIEGCYRGVKRPIDVIDISDTDDETDNKDDEDEDLVRDKDDDEYKTEDDEDNDILAVFVKKSEIIQNLLRTQRKLMKIIENNNKPVILISDETHNAINVQNSQHNNMYKMLVKISEHKLCIFRILMTATPIVKNDRNQDDLNTLLSIMTPKHSRCENVEQCFDTSLTDNVNKVFCGIDGYVLIYNSNSKLLTHACEIHKKYIVPMDTDKFKELVKLRENQSKLILHAIFYFCHQVVISSQLKNTDFVDWKVAYNEKELENIEWKLLKLENYQIGKTQINQYIEKFFELFKSISKTQQIFPNSESKLLYILKFYEWSKLRLYKFKEFNKDAFYSHATNIFRSSEEEDEDSLDDGKEKLFEPYLTTLQIIFEKIDLGELPIVVHDDRLDAGISKLYEILTEPTKFKISLEKILKGKLTLNKLNEKVSFGLITGDSCKTKERGSIGLSNILEDFQQGNIDVLMFSKVIKEGVDLKSSTSFSGNFIWCISSDNKYAYYRRKTTHFWKQKIAFSKINKDSLMIGNVNVANYTNPVKHFIHMGMKWDMKSLHQATGRCLRGDSHPIHYDSNGDIDDKFPRGILYVHNILVWNPFYMPGTISKNDESDLLTVDQRKEEIIHEKLKKTERIMTSLSARCVDCTLKTAS